jgi:4-aminobutyrate aminotransferase-like enzyme
MGEKKLFQTDKAAVAAEPVQGEGGFIAPPRGYFQELVKICCKRRKP